MSDITTETHETSNGIAEHAAPKTRKPRTSGGGDVLNVSASISAGTSIPDLFAQAHAKSLARRVQIGKEIEALQTENRTLLTAEGAPELPSVFDKPRRAGTKTRARSAKPGVARAGTKTGKKPSARLARRSAEDIDAMIEKVVALVKKAGPAGLRAEEIRTSLGLEAKELPRVFAQAKESKLLKSRGQKRATVYLLGAKG